MRTRVVQRRDAVRRHRGPSREAEDEQRKDEDVEHRELHLARLDLLAQVLGGAPDHQAGDEHRQEHHHQHSVEAGADAAEDHLAELDVDERNQAAQRREAVVHRVDRAAGRVGRHRGEQRRGSDAEARFLAFEVPSGLVHRQAAQRGIARCLRRIGDGDARDEQRGHRTKEGPALLLAAGHAPVQVGERAGDGEDQQELEEVAERGRVLERVSAVGVEEAAAVGAQLLDGLLRGDRPQGQELLRALEGGDLAIGGEILDHALPDE